MFEKELPVVRSDNWNRELRQINRPNRIKSFPFRSTIENMFFVDHLRMRLFRPGDRNPGRDAQCLNIDGKEFTAQLADAVYPVTGGVMDKMTRTSRRGSHFPRKCYFFTRRGFPLFCITQGIALP